MKKVALRKIVGNRSGETLAVGAGIAALSVAAYILLGPNGKKHRRELRGWAVRMKGEMIEKFEQAKELTEPVYQRIVQEVSSHYAKQKEVNTRELRAIAADLRSHWQDIVRGSANHHPARRESSQKQNARAGSRRGTA